MTLEAAPQVLALVADDSGPTLWRVWSPFAELRRRGLHAYWKHRDDPELQTPAFVNSIPSKFHALLLPRMSWTERAYAEHWIRVMHAFGLVVILEMDDDVFSPGIVARQYAVHERERAKGLEQLERNREMRQWLLGQVDGLTVSTWRLATIAGRFTDKPIEVVPNAIDTRWFREVLRDCRRVVPPLTIGWAGGARYAEDLVEVAEAWRRIAQRYPDVTFVVQGFMTEVLLDAVPPDRLRTLRWLPLDQYPRGLVNIDIACCSVAPKLFNTAKSAIKLWEYTLAGAACVVSPTLYGPYVEHGVDALVATTADDWEAALACLIENPDLRRQLRREQRRRIASEHSLEHNWWKWPAAWQSILDQHHQTTASRLLVS